MAFFGYLCPYQHFVEMTSNMIYTVAFGGGLKFPRKILLNTQSPRPPRRFENFPRIVKLGETRLIESWKYLLKMLHSYLFPTDCKKCNSEKSVNISLKVKRFFLKWLCGLIVKASDFESEDCGFKSHHNQFCFFHFFYFFFKFLKLRKQISDWSNFFFELFSHFWPLEKIKTNIYLIFNIKHCHIPILLKLFFTFHRIYIFKQTLKKNHNQCHIFC